MASLAGAWSALVAGFGGMRASPSIGFGPRLPTAIARLAFRVCYRGRHLSVTVTAASATYELLDGPPSRSRTIARRSRQEIGAWALRERKSVDSGRRRYRSLAL